MNPVIVAAIISLVIILIYAIQVYYAYTNNILIFQEYVVEGGDDFVLYNKSPQPLDSDQIAENKQAAANICATLANMQNPVSTYCSAASPASGIDCSNI